MAAEHVLVPVNEATDVASARRIAAQLAQRSEFAGDAGALAIIVTEAATNLIKHAGGGDLLMRAVSNGAGCVMELIAVDRGPGMPWLDRCFTDGYSTVGSPGNGLGALARLSGFHDVYSIGGKGTVLLAHVGAPVRPGPWSPNTPLQYSAINIPYPGEETSGDAWSIHAAPERTRFMLADGLGHGVFASAASAAALELIREPTNASPADVLTSAHERLRATRGAAAAVIDVDRSLGFVTFAGIGNVSACIVAQPPAPRRQMVSINGTLGHEMRSVRQYQYPLEPESLIVVHSDGLSTHWSFEKYPGLFERHTAVIAAVLFRDFRRPRDDASIIVARTRGRVG